MNGRLIIIVILGSLVSLIGTMIGASLGVLVKNPSKKLLGAIISFAAGLMMAVVVFDLIPEAIEKGTFGNTLLFCFIGILVIMFIDYLSEGALQGVVGNKYIKVAFMVALGLMLHNLPEGIIMGCGFVAGGSLGLKMSLIIAIHDIPEGIAVSAPLMASRVKVYKILFYAFLTALPTAIGAWFGVQIGSISNYVLSVSLSLASGIMLYVVCGEMIPESSKLWDGITNTIGILLGIILGLIITNVL